MARVFNVETFRTLGASDDSPAIQAALDAAQAAGGGVVEAPNQYTCTSPINIDGYQRITLLGQHGYTDNNNARPSSQITFNIASSGTALSARGCRALVFKDIAIAYASGSFTGTLIDFSRQVTTDATWKIIRCTIGSDLGAAWSAACLIRANKSIISSISESRLGFAAVGIRLRETSSDYANAINIQGCFFSDFRTGAIANPGNLCNIVGNTFQGNLAHIASPGMAPALFTDIGAESASSNNWTSALNFVGNLTGDGDGSSYVIDLNTRVRGLNITGNCLGATASGGVYKLIRLASVYGGIIPASLFYGNIDFTPGETVTGLVVQGNAHAESPYQAFGNPPSGGVTATPWGNVDSGGGAT